MAPTPLAAAYATLGLAPGATEAEIKRAWRSTARATHPDLNPDDPHAARRFREAEAAHALLTDPARRAAGAQAPAHGGPDDDWIDACAWMAEAHLLRLRRDILPRYAAAHRGGPSLAAALAAASDRGLADHAPAVAPTRWARAWAWHTWRTLELVVDDGPPMARGPVALFHERGRVRIVLWPGVLWAGGVRDDDAVRALVLRSVDLGVAAAAPMVLGLAERGAPDPASDGWWWAGRLFWPAMWGFTVVFSVFLLGTALWRVG